MSPSQQSGERQSLMISYLGDQALNWRSRWPWLHAVSWGLFCSLAVTDSLPREFSFPICKCRDGAWGPEKAGRVWKGRQSFRFSVASRSLQDTGSILGLRSICLSLGWQIVSSPTQAWASLVAQRWWICLQCGRPRFDPWVAKILQSRTWQPTPVFLPGEFHGQWNLAGYSPLDHKSVRYDLQLNTTTTTQAWFLSRTHSIKHLTYGKDNRVFKCASSCQPTRATLKYVPRLNRKLANVITLLGLWQRVRTIKILTMLIEIFWL